jgi:hypothetical protein
VENNGNGIVFYYSADGACKHVAATLYAVAAWNDDFVSCTSKPAKWLCPSVANDEPEPLQHLNVRSSRYICVVKVYMTECGHGVLSQGWLPCITAVLQPQT